MWVELFAHATNIRTCDISAIFFILMRLRQSTLICMIRMRFRFDSLQERSQIDAFYFGENSQRISVNGRPSVTHRNVCVFKRKHISMDGARGNYVSWRGLRAKQNNDQGEVTGLSLHGIIFLRRRLPTKNSQNSQQPKLFSVMVNELVSMHMA